MSQSLDVAHSSAYCLAITIGARQTLAPPTAETSQTKPDSQSASRRQSSPSLRPYANKQFPITENKREKLLRAIFLYEQMADSVVARLIGFQKNKQLEGFKNVFP